MAIIDISSSTKRIWVIGGTVPSTRTVTTATWASSLATYTTSAAHGYSVGHIVTVTGITPSGYNVAAGAITATPSGTTFKLAVTPNPGAYSSGGTVTPNCIDGGIDLNDQSNTFLKPGTSLGEPVRGETWITPKVPGAPAVLAQFWDEPATVTLILRLKYASTGTALTAADAIRAAFNSANTLWQSYKGQTNLRSFTTYKSPVPPLITGNNTSDRFRLADSGEVDSWTIQVKRYPWPDGTTTIPV